MTLRRELLTGRARMEATTAVLQRARRADPLVGLWEAADVQWWWRRERASDHLALPVWFDDGGPVAAAGVTAWPDAWQVDVHAVLSLVDPAEVWAAALEGALAAAAGAPDVASSLRVLVRGDDGVLVELAQRDGFALTEDRSGTTWVDAADRPVVAPVAGYRIEDRAARPGGPHPMIGRNGDRVEARLRECSLYDPTLDLVVLEVDSRGVEVAVAGYALFWADATTGVGLVEPMRVEDAHQRRGLGRALLAEGCDRLARHGARRLKVGFTSEGAGRLYVSSGFVQTSVDRELVRPVDVDTSHSG